MQITTVGLDLAKNVFQVHAVDEEGRAIVRRRLRRGEVRDFFAGLAPCLIGMEACGTAHFWARERVAFGHEVRIMPPPAPGHGGEPCFDGDCRGSARPAADLRKGTGSP